MSKRKRRQKSLGLPPGAVVFTGKRKVEKIQIHYLEYNEEEVEDQEVSNQSITKFHEPDPNLVQWYDIRGLHDTALIEELGRIFNIHPLALEDIADTLQRPKLDEYDNGLFITLRALSYDTENKKIIKEHVALFLGDAHLLTFQENETDLFAGVRERILSKKGRIRGRKADYLAYAVIDAVVDNYYIVLDALEEDIEELERLIISESDAIHKRMIHSMKQELLILRRSISPLREAISSFERSEFAHLAESTRLFLRDTRDHTFHILELTETYRDLLNSLHDLYLSELSFRMNNIMQLLTIMSTIFIPLSFLTGLYGMNFEYMPELSYHYGYFILLSIMGILLVTMLIIFRRRKWF
jgi:magnesium transporter